MFPRQIVSSQILTLPLMLKPGKPAGRGTITVSAQELKDSRVVTMEVEARNLDKKDFLGKSDPFLEFFRQGDGKWHLAYRSEVIKNNLNPTWKRFSVPFQHFCGETPVHPSRCDVRIMTAMVHMISLVPSTLPWPNCRQSRLSLNASTLRNSRKEKLQELWNSPCQDLSGRNRVFIPGLCDGRLSNQLHCGCGLHRLQWRSFLT